MYWNDCTTYLIDLNESRECGCVRDDPEQVVIISTIYREHDLVHVVNVGIVDLYGGDGRTNGFRFQDGGSGVGVWIELWHVIVHVVDGDDDWCSGCGFHANEYGSL